MLCRKHLCKTISMNAVCISMWVQVLGSQIWPWVLNACATVVHVIKCMWVMVNHCDSTGFTKFLTLQNLQYRKCAVHEAVIKLQSCKPGYACSCTFPKDCFLKGEAGRDVMQWDAGNTGSYWGRVHKLPPPPMWEQGLSFCVLNGPWSQVQAHLPNPSANSLP